MAIEKDLPPVQGNVEATDVELPSGIALEPGVEITEDEEGVEINFEPGKEIDTEFNENIAEKMDERDLSSLSSELITEFKDFIGGQEVVDARAKLTFLNLLSNSNASAIAATCESPQISARS